MEDLASHARVGVTQRTAVMFGPPGRAYVYLTYGMHHCLNIVTEPAGKPAALLVRAVEPVTGIAQMRDARVGVAALRATGDRLDRERERIERLPPARVAAGPGLVCAAFDVDRLLNGADMLDASSPLRLQVAAEPIAAALIATGPRIGMGATPQPWHGMPWRFTIESPALSRPGARRPHGHEAATGDAAAADGPAGPAEASR